MFVVGCGFVVCVAVYCRVLFVVLFLSFVVCCSCGDCCSLSLFVVGCLMCVVCGLFSVVCGLLFVFVVMSLSVGCCLLCVVSCMFLFVCSL